MWVMYMECYSRRGLNRIGDRCNLISGHGAMSVEGEMEQTDRQCSRLLNCLLLPFEDCPTGSAVSDPSVGELNEHESESVALAHVLVRQDTLLETKRTVVRICKRES
jgi:hypothetical protein